MKDHTVRVYPSAQTPAKEEQLAWKLAEVATDCDEAVEMVINRVIDNAQFTSIESALIKLQNKWVAYRRNFNPTTSFPKRQGRHEHLPNTD